MTTAFVLSGGGSLGAVQVGMLHALSERHVRPDMLIGTSAGALNAAYVAGHGTDRRALDDLATVWRTLRRRDVFPFDPVRHTLAITGLRPSLCSNLNLRRLIDTHLPYRRLEGAAVPVHVVTTNLLSGEEVLLSDGDAVSAVLASAAIPGVFPAVAYDGMTLIDGGVADNAALSQAVALGAEEIYVLPAGFACALPYAPSTAIGTAVHALTLLIEQRLIADIAHFAGHARISVLPPLCPLNVSATDFSPVPPSSSNEPTAAPVTGLTPADPRCPNPSGTCLCTTTRPDLRHTRPNTTPATPHHRPHRQRRSQGRPSSAGLRR